MKKLNTYLIGLVLIASSCKNIEKMVDKGNYDQAISYAVDKLEGKKNKKTKYVKALERAYHKINQEDLDKIALLESKIDINTYDKVYDIYNRMHKRQVTVHRLHPLVSKDGYRARLGKKDYTRLINNAAQKAANAHYSEAKRLLDHARTKDKYIARQAYKQLGYIERYYKNYMDTDILYEEAYNLGVDHVQLSVYVDPYERSRLGVFNLDAIDVSNLDRFWTKYHTYDNGMEYDYTATLEINQVDLGREYQRYNRYTETREIEDGTQPVKDVNGNIVKDTLGNTIYTKKYRTISADITEMVREKHARLIGKVVLYHNHTNTVASTRPIEVTHNFDDYSLTYNGDKRALTDRTLSRVKTSCPPFPSDFYIADQLTDNFKAIAIAELKREL